STSSLDRFHSALRSLVGIRAAWADAPYLLDLIAEPVVILERSFIAFLERGRVYHHFLLGLPATAAVADPFAGSAVAMMLLGGDLSDSSDGEDGASYTGLQGLKPAGVTALCLVLLVLFMRETRTSIILTRRAKKLRAETGDDRYRSVAEVELPSLTLLIISCTRPLREWHRPSARPR
ncbi:hypothetical protein FA95DRAFT_1612734, partial [Auriscalpium vulgare]